MPYPKQSFRRRSRISREAARRRRALGLVLAAGAVAVIGGSLAGASSPSLQERIDSARSDAQQLGARIDSKSGRISGLQTSAREAGGADLVATAITKQGAGQGKAWIRRR